MASTPQLPPAPASPRSQIALITGAGSGIGEACAHALLKRGWTVVFAGRQRERLEAAIARRPAETSEAQAEARVCDVSDAASVAELFADIAQRHGRLDLLFNNAGVFTAGLPLEEVPLDAWKAAVDINLTGAFLCTQAAFRLMKAQRPRGGRIINNGSISAHSPRPNAVAYTATKHAITGLTRSAALEGRAFDIAVGQIDIGNASTDMTEAMARGLLQADGSVRVEVRMDVTHVAEAVVQMASLPLSANVLFMTVMATGMPFVGRG
jgi:NAD(P)-dependent dehydrogenase (short-subunit alcohol dehydrogenase family)